MTKNSYWISFAYKIGKVIIDGIAKIPDEIPFKEAEEMLKKHEASKIPPGKYTEMLEKTLKLKELGE